MAALRFQIHVDKENVGSIGVNPKMRQGSTAMRTKTFQENGTPGFVKPRKALGDCDINTPASLRPSKPLGNRTNESALKTKPGGLKPFSMNKKSLKSENRRSQEKSVKKQEPKVVASVLPASIGVQPTPICEEIEKMHNERDPDDSEDVWPARERISTYIDKLISWRPPCLYGGGSMSDDEDYDRNIQHMMAQLSEMPAPKVSIEDDVDLPEDFLVPIPDEDVPFPDVSLIDLSQEMTLDDSYNVPNLGTLSLKDD